MVGGHSTFPEREATWVSLTQILGQPGHPVSQFFRSAFPDAARFAHHWQEALTRDGRPDTLRPAGDLKGYPWAAVGQAVDYLCRVALQPYRLEDTVAHHGYRLAVQELPAAYRATVIARWADLARVWRTAVGATPRAWAELAPLAMVAAEFETVYRAGHVGSLLITPGPLAAIRRRVPAPVVQDLVQLITVFEAQRPAAPDPRIVLSPTFAGSSDVGGADGDFIWGGTLWDIKTTLHPERARAPWAYQLVGYLLLDYPDAYGLSGGGWYLARQGRWLAWDWPTLCDLLGATPDALPAWRARFRRALGVEPGPKLAI